jgi:hypothetical protein
MVFVRDKNYDITVINVRYIISNMGKTNQQRNVSSLNNGVQRGPAIQKGKIIDRDRLFCRN